MLPEAVLNKVRFEIEEIDNLLTVYEPLLNLARKRNLDLIEKTALAQVLHSFYNGLENIFLVVSKSTDGFIPTGVTWHRELLNQVSAETENRKPVLNTGTNESLLEYLGFRHVVRHIYSTNLDIDRMIHLAVKMRAVWESTKKDLVTFITSE